MSDPSTPDWQRAHLSEFLADDVNKARLLAYARHFMTRSLNTDAEDLVQDAALAITRTMKNGKFNYQGDLALMGYLKRCISRAFAMRCRKTLGTSKSQDSKELSNRDETSKSRRPTVSGMDCDYGLWVDDLGRTPLDEACVRELDDQLHAIINDLPEKDREVIIREFWHDETAIETAGDIARTVGSVRHIRKRARIQIRQRLDP